MSSIYELGVNSANSEDFVRNSSYLWEGFTKLIFANLPVHGAFFELPCTFFNAPACTKRNVITD
jgi:hypothetical protein